MTWTVQDTAIMLQAIAGYDPKDSASSKARVPDYARALRQYERHTAWRQKRPPL